MESVCSPYFDIPVARKFATTVGVIYFILFCIILSHFKLVPFASIRNILGGGGVLLCRIATNILNKMGLTGDWRQGVILQLATRIDKLAAPYHKNSVLTVYKTGLRTLQHFVKRVMNVRFPHILTT
jgi:hypothetical protein